jgi:hypothetical protein
MVNKNYLGVFFNPVVDIEDDIIIISNNTPRLIKGDGILLSTFSSNISVKELSDYFISLGRKFIITEIYDSQCVNNFNDEETSNEFFSLFGFDNEINKMQQSFTDDAFKSFFSFISDSTNNTTNNYNFDLSFLPIIEDSEELPIEDNLTVLSDEEINNLSDSEVIKMIDELIDKGLANLSKYDRILLDKLSKK